MAFDATAPLDAIIHQAYDRQPKDPAIAGTAKANTVPASAIVLSPVANVVLGDKRR